MNPTTASSTPSRGGAPVTGERVALDVVVTRGAIVESQHRVHAAVVDHHGRLLLSSRDPHQASWWRSCAKPFQVMPLVAQGGLDALEWGEDELALACASHGGEPEHVAIAEAMLARIGLEEGDLACGPHEPLAARGVKLVRESGHRITRLHNNCSGKHAAMLARAVTTGAPASGYERADHPVQRDARDSIAQWADLPPESLHRGVDGCGVTVFGLPLFNMALSYARLAHAASAGQPVPRRIVGAMTRNPFLVGGTDRFDTLLMEAFAGRVLCKIGAEGVHTLAIVDRGIGIALKVQDGAQRAQFPAVLALLAALGERSEHAALAELVQRPVRNTRGETVGEIRVGGGSVGDPA